MLWVDKHRPRNLGDLTLHSQITRQLERLVQSSDFPHILLHGPPGAGKRTRALALIRGFFGATAERVRPEHSSVEVSEGKSIEIPICVGAHHVEVNATEAGPTHDRAVVMQLVKSLAASVPITAAEPASGGGGAARGFKVLLLGDVDGLSKGAQHALRRTMERHMGTCRCILIAESTSRVIAPLRSRCVPIRVPAPSVAEVAATVGAVAAVEGADLPALFCQRVAEASGRNLRRALLAAETARVCLPAVTPTSPVVVPDWLVLVRAIARGVVEEQTPRRLLEARASVFELLAACIPPAVVLREITMALVPLCDAEVRRGVVSAAAYYDHTMHGGSKPVVHIEAFLARAMLTYRAAAEAVDDAAARARQ